MEIKIPVELPNDWCEKVAEKVMEKGDFVLVIRCKDCKHFRNGICFSEQWWNDDGAVTINENDFCSYAEPKELERID